MEIIQEIKEPSLIGIIKEKKVLITKTAKKSISTAGQKTIKLAALAGMRPSIPLAAVSHFLHYHPDSNLSLSGFKFIQSSVMAGITKVFGVFEIAGDKMKRAPNRISLMPLLARIATGSLLGAVMFNLNKEKAYVGSILGGITSMISTYLSFFIRKRLGESLTIQDYMVGLAEDIICIRSSISAIKN
jgi:uncharacterized membrane protein